MNKDVEHCVASQSAGEFQRLLEMTAVRDRDIDQQVCDDWAAVDQKAWHQLDQQENTQAKPAIRKGAKSTSLRLTQR